MIVPPMNAHWKRVPTRCPALAMASLQRQPPSQPASQPRACPACFQPRHPRRATKNDAQKPRAAPGSCARGARRAAQPPRRAAAAPPNGAGAPTAAARCKKGAPVAVATRGRPSLHGQGWGTSAAVARAGRLRRRPPGRAGATRGLLWAGGRQQWRRQRAAVRAELLLVLWSLRQGGGGGERHGY